jgi:hypothetical protein
MCKTENNNNNNNKPLDSNSIKTLNTIKMKKMKKSLLTLLTAILIGSSFTSCVENTIPDEVVAIYDGQANLLAAQAALLAAEANEANAAAALSAAMTAAEQARTAAQTIANAYAQANNTILLAAAQAALASQIATDAANLADQEAALIARTAEHATTAALAQAQLDALVANNAATTARNAEELAALIAQNDVDNSAAIAALEARIAQNAIDAANAEAALAATIAQNAIDAATAQEALANTIAHNALALEAAQEELANMVAENVLELARQQAALEAVVAQAVIDAEKALLELALAQATHANAMEALAQQLAQIGDSILDTYFDYYEFYATKLNTARGLEVTANLAVINEMAANALLVQTDAEAIAGFENDKSIAESAKADLVAQKDILEDSIAAGTSIGDNTAKAAELQAEIDAIDVVLFDLAIEIAELTDVQEAQGAVVGAMILDLGLAGLATEFGTLKTDLATAIGNKAIQTAAYVADSTNIANWTETITNYAATTATLEGNIVSAEAAADAADTAADTAATAAADASDALDDANDARDDAADLIADENDELDDLNDDVDTAQADVNAAAEAWVIAKDNLANSTTQLDVDNATAALILVQAAYDVAVMNFEDQTLDFTWNPGPDGELGIQADGNQPAVATYKVVTSVTVSGAPGAEVYTATYSEATNLDITGGGNEIDPDALDEFTSNGDYYEFGIDDVPTNDLVEFQAATVALTAAKDALETATDLNIDLEPAVTAAQTLYEDTVYLYENAVDIVATQQGVVDAAIAAANAAMDVADNADEAADDADEAADAADEDVITANTAVTTAETALTTHTDTTIATYESDIEDLQVAILQRNITIADMDIAIAVIEADIVIVLAKLNAGKPQDLIDAEAMLVITNIELAGLTATQVMETASKATKLAIINLIAAPSALTLNAIGEVDILIAAQDALIAAAQVSIDTYSSLTIVQRDALNAQTVTDLETALANIQSDIELYTALSAKYKDLVDSLL